MSGWSLWQFDHVVDDFLSNCDQEMAAILAAKLALLSEKGNLAGMPLTKPLRKGILELRANYRGMQPRLFFCFRSGKKIYFVHAVNKKGSQVPNQDIELAIQRKKLIESGKVTANVIDYVN